MLPLLGLLLACNTQPRLEDDGSVCAEARALMGGCGVTLTILQVRECVGPSQAVAECVVEHADTCEDLASIRFDQCADDVLDPVTDDPPYDPIPTDPGPRPEPSPEDDAAENTDALCADGIDNDDDGFTDCDDVECSFGEDVTVCDDSDTE